MMVEIGVPPALSDAVESIKDAISAGRTDIFRKLLEACETCEGGGIEERKQLVNSLSTKDGTFLHMATKLGHNDIVRALLASGADPGILDKNGNTPLQVSPSQSILSIFMEDLLGATAKSEIGRVCQLIASGMNVNAYDNELSKNTPLHWAASYADLDTVNCLIARGANVNICNSEGATPLHDAVARGADDIVEALLEQGANPHILCQQGRYKDQTAFQLAHKNLSLLETMKKHNNNNNRNSLQNGIPNGSASPVLARSSFADAGSLESSFDTESTIAHNNSKNSQSPEIEAKLIRAQSLASIGSESIISQSNHLPNGKIVNAQTNIRSPLESTSSFELTPNMEQVCERLSAIQLATPPRPLVTNTSLHDLWPQPKRITELDGPLWKVPNIVNLTITSHNVLVHSIVDVWNIHKPWLSDVGCDIQLGSVIGPFQSNERSACITCVVDSTLTLSEAHYNIAIDKDGVSIVCGSLSSLHHALITFAQLLRVFKTDELTEEGGNEEEVLSIPPLVITDFPSIPNRGFLLDMTPAARIPILDRLCQIVDSLVSFKINQFHLLFKICFISNENALLENGFNNIECICHLPYSSSELVSLERYCNDRGLYLVPGFELDLEKSAGHTLSIKDISRVISQVLVNFSSTKYVQIGPFLTSVIADASNNSPNPWVELHIPNSASLMVCANAFHSNKEALRKLPLPTILVEYGFQADYDFSQGCKLATEKGRPLAICSGTAAWTSLSGWPEAGVSNVYSGVVSSLESGANCLLVANWSNTACLTPLVFAWPPLLVAAGLSWNHTTHWDYVHSSVGSLIDKHLVKIPNCGFGDAIIELGRWETWLTRSARDQHVNDPNDLPSCTGSTLHQFLVDPDAVIVDYLTVESFARVMRYVRKAVKDGVHRNKPHPPIGISEIPSISKWPLASLAVLELHLTIDMILTACRLGRSIVTVGTNPRSNMGMAVINLGVANLPPTLRTDLANKILALREVYSSVWLQGHQSNGLQSSLLVFTSLLSKLLPEQTVHGV